MGDGARSGNASQATNQNLKKLAIVNQGAGLNSCNYQSARPKTFPPPPEAFSRRPISL